MASNWQIGDRILNRWEIHKILKGGMGIVYVVYDHEWHEAFAAKTFQDEVFARSPAIADHFKQEALAWVGLDTHQNVVEARFVRHMPDKPYLFLEYVSGGDLSTWISRPRLTEDLPQVLRFGIQCCDGMTHAFAKGIKAHRDLKPQNCLITGDRTLKVTDFGLAKVFDDIEQIDVEIPEPHGLTVALTRTGTAAGTPTHMAPEQFDDAKNVDVRADIYSFGVMLYQMLTGRLPFEARTPQEFELLHKGQQVPSLGQQSSAPKKIVERCLAKDPVNRYADFTEVRDGLAETYEELTGDKAPAAVVGPALDAIQWGNKGANLGELSRPDEALVCHDRALAINPRLAQAWYNKGNALDQLGRPNEALACYDRALEIEPNYNAARSNQGYLLSRLGRSEEALACVALGPEVNPYSVRAWTNKGNTLLVSGQPEEALACYERALTIDLRDAEAWMSKGSALDALGRREEAVEAYDKALIIEPNYHLAWSNKGCALDSLGRGEEALKCLDRALEIQMDFDRVWLNKGNVLNRMGRREEAIACYDRALQISSNFAAAWYKKGNVVCDLGNLYEGIVCYDRALEINPRIEMAWFNKAVTLYQLGLWGKVVPCLDRALEINSRNEMTWYYKGMVLFNGFRRYRDALECFEQARRLDHPQAGLAVALCRTELRWQV